MERVFSLPLFQMLQNRQRLMSVGSVEHLQQRRGTASEQDRVFLDKIAALQAWLESGKQPFNFTVGPILTGNQT